ncbi:MAG: alpha/beta hydrolase [Actinomycetota bacterium]
MLLSHKAPSHWLKKIYLLLLGCGSALLTILPANAAEKIYFQYGPIIQSLQVSSLKTFAETGVVPSDLKFYFNFLKADEQAQQKLRRLLNARSKVNLVLLSRFLYTSVGEDFLKQFGSYIRTQSGINGNYALRAAILLSASDPEGVSVLSLLHHYPTDLQIDIQSILSLLRAANIVFDATDFFSKAVAQLSALEAQSELATDFSAKADLRQPGSFEVKQRRWQLRDEKRDRSFYVDIYQPQRGQAKEIPIIIISHGLASNPEDFAKRAQYLASYGYVVAVPQHPGSDTIQARNLVQGLSREVFVNQEFIDRPLDISYVLDELERRNQTEFAGQLNVQSVGVMGHSFGGYTALALAGATIDFEHLQQSCNNNLEYLDISLFLQCQALKLPRKPYNFRDRRVTAVYALNPVNYSIFGATGLSQIAIPILLEAGTYDPATPAIFEQVRSFNWLTTPNKYLALLEGQAHVNFSDLDAGFTKLLDSISSLTLPHPALLNDYSNALTLAFFEVSLLNNEVYRPYLQATYTQYLSRDQAFKVFLIGSQSDEGLERSSEIFRSRL